MCRAAIGRARQSGANKIFLESNTILKPAVSLYRKLGFIELRELHPAYERGDIQMELTLDMQRNQGLFCNFALPIQDRVL